MQRSLYEMDIENERNEAVREGHELGRQQGLKEGRHEGHEQGLKEGREQGREDGRKEGQAKERLSLVTDLIQSCLLYTSPCTFGLQQHLMSSKPFHLAYRNLQIRNQQQLR